MELTIEEGSFYEFQMRDENYRVVWLAGGLPSASENSGKNCFFFLWYKNLKCQEIPIFLWLLSMNTFLKDKKPLCSIYPKGVIILTLLYDKWSTFDPHN